MRNFLLLMLMVHLVGCASLPGEQSTLEDSDASGMSDDPPSTQPDVQAVHSARVTNNHYSERDLTRPWFDRTYWSKSKASDTSSPRDPELRVGHYQPIDCQFDQPQQVTSVDPAMASANQPASAAKDAGATRSDRTTIIPFAKNSIVLGPVGRAKLGRLIERLVGHCEAIKTHDCIRLIGATLGDESVGASTLQYGESTSQDYLAVGRAAAVKAFIVKSSSIARERIRILQRDPSWQVRRVQVHLNGTS